MIAATAASTSSWANDLQDPHRDMLSVLGQRQGAAGRARQLPARRRLFSFGAAPRAKDESRRQV
jgi:hypothetical protein